MDRRRCLLGGSASAASKHYKQQNENSLGGLLSNPLISNCHEQSSSGQPRAVEIASLYANGRTKPKETTAEFLILAIPGQESNVTNYRPASARVFCCDPKFTTGKLRARRIELAPSSSIYVERSNREAARLAGRSFVM